MSSCTLGSHIILFFFFFNDTATTEIYTLSLHDALPISPGHEARPAAAQQRGITPVIVVCALCSDRSQPVFAARRVRSEEHTSELQSPCNLVCRLLLEKKKKSTTTAR